jgi:hypothetical protein
VAIGTGTVLATRGWCEGVHAWEFTVAQCGWFSWAGVSYRDPCDEEEVRRGYVLSGNDGGFCFAGAGAEYRSTGAPMCSAAYHAGLETQAQYALFTDGDVVRLVLDCDKGSLALLINGRLIGTAFNGLLRCREIYPAFAGSGLETRFTDMKFDVPLDQP